MMLLTRWGVTDVRGSLVMGRQPKARKISEVHGLVVHHTAAPESYTPERVAHDHVAKGWPSIGYHFWVERDGTILQLNDLSAVVNHSRGRVPVPHLQPNQNLAAVVFPGDYRTLEPTPAQRGSLLLLFAILREALGVEEDMLFSHRELKTTACPGIHLVREVNSIVGRSGAGVGGALVRQACPRNVSEAQRALDLLGHKLDIDGIWGPQTNECIIQATGISGLNFRSAYALAKLLMTKNPAPRTI